MWNSKLNIFFNFSLKTQNKDLEKQARENKNRLNKSFNLKNSINSIYSEENSKKVRLNLFFKNHLCFSFRKEIYQKVKREKIKILIF